MEACLAGLCIHVMLSYAPIVLAEKAYSEQLYVTEIDMSVFEPECCMVCRGGGCAKGGERHDGHDQDGDRQRLPALRWRPERRHHDVMESGF